MFGSKGGKIVKNTKYVSIRLKQVIKTIEDQKGKPLSPGQKDLIITTLNLCSQKLDKLSKLSEQIHNLLDKEL